MAAKILLVEDDKSLREIYGVRLQAEGYVIVSASDGEQALAMAIKERPVLIITDVMMPKISGFDMLDILRSTTETKDIKVIMMTALSSDDQRSRGERMGADRYLVKSQVGIEDVVRTVHEVLGDSTATPAAAPATPAPVASATQAAAPQAATSQPTPAPAMGNVPAQSPAAPSTPAQQPSVPAQPAPLVPPAATPATDDQPVQPHPPVPLQTSTIPAAPSAKQRVIQPLSSPDEKVDINALLDKELAKEAGLDMLSRPQVASTEQEKAMVENQLQQAVQAAPAPAPSPAPEAPVETPPAAPEPPATVPPAAPPTPSPDRPAAPTIPPRDSPLQTPPRIPTI